MYVIKHSRVCVCTHVCVIGQGNVKGCERRVLYKTHLAIKIVFIIILRKSIDSKIK